MDIDEKTKYRIQVLCFRVKDEDEKYLSQKVMRISSSEEKIFSKHDHVDNYLLVMRGDKIEMLIRQVTSIFPIKYLVGYDVQFSEAGKNDSFCQFQVLLEKLEITKSKLPSEYKELFKNKEKRIERLDEYEGVKLKDLVMYPVDIIKDISLSKNQYFLVKKPVETQSESSESSSSQDSSDDSSDSSSSEEQSKSRRKKSTKDRKIKKEKDRKDKDKERRRKKRKDKERERQRDRKKKSKDEKSRKRGKEKENKHKKDRSEDRHKKSKEDKKKHKDRQQSKKKSKD